MAVAYKRVLIKISGEALAAEKKTGYDFSFVSAVCESVKRCVEMGAEVGIVVGGGNFWRGVKDGDGKIERVSADRMGMLATAMNGLALADVFAQCGVNAKLLTAVDIQGVGERYDTKKAIEYLESGKVVIFGCGTGMPFFSTDTAAVLRAAEIHADAILLNTTRSATATCSLSALRSWTRQPPAWPWTIPSPSSSSPWPNRRTSSGCFRAKSSVHW